MGAPPQEPQPQVVAPAGGNPVSFPFADLIGAGNLSIFGGAQLGKSLGRLRAETEPAGVAGAVAPSSPPPAGLPPQWVVHGGGPTSPYNQLRPPVFRLPSYAAVHGAGAGTLVGGRRDGGQTANGAVGGAGDFAPASAAGPSNGVAGGGGPSQAQSGPARGGPGEARSVTGGGTAGRGAIPLGQSGPAGGVTLVRPAGASSGVPCRGPLPLVRSGPARGGRGGARVADVLGQPLGGGAAAVAEPEVAIEFVRMFVQDPTLTVTVRFRAGATIREVKAEKSRCGVRPPMYKQNTARLRPYPLCLLSFSSSPLLAPHQQNLVSCFGGNVSNFQVWPCDSGQGFACIAVHHGQQD